MSDERRRILEMLAEGKVTAAEAEDLLNALYAEKDKQQPVRKEAQFLRIRVYEAGKNKVNVNVPLSLAKVAMKFIPDEAKNQMADKNIDLDSIIREIQNGVPAGKLVEVEDDDERVEIFID